jgi:hypothetical protein
MFNPLFFLWGEKTEINGTAFKKSNERAKEFTITCKKVLLVTDTWGKTMKCFLIVGYRLDNSKRLW